MKGIKFAWEIVEKAFESKSDLSGEPYIKHIQRVHQAVCHRNKDVQSIAILHDLLEDCEEWNEKILRTFFYEEIVDAVVALTKGKNEDYSEYIKRVSENNYAVIVKRADLKDNLDASRLIQIKEGDVSRLKKYLLAFQTLSNL